MALVALVAVVPVAPLVQQLVQLALLVLLYLLVLLDLLVQDQEQCHSQQGRPSHPRQPLPAGGARRRLRPP